MIIRDVNSSLSVKNDLNRAIFQRFREAGVEIPYPQQELRIRGPELETGHPAQTENSAAAAAHRARSDET